MDESEQDFHHFLRRSPSGNLEVVRIIFGVTSSPYLARFYNRKHWTIRQTTLSYFYVDDCLTGADKEQAKTLQKQLCSFLDCAGMMLRKWWSNSAELLESIPEHLREKSPDLCISTDLTTNAKVLGIHWNTSSDVFYVAVLTLDEGTTPTKRNIASAMAHLFMMF